MPFLVQWIEGTGTPEAVQVMTAGARLVTRNSIGSSAMVGGTETKQQRTTHFPLPPHSQSQFVPLQPGAQRVGVK